MREATRIRRESKPLLLRLLRLLWLLRRRLLLLGLLRSMVLLWLRAIQLQIIIKNLLIYEFLPLLHCVFFLVDRVIIGT